MAESRQLDLILNLQDKASKELKKVAGRLSEIDRASSGFRSSISNIGSRFQTEFNIVKSVARKATGVIVGLGAGIAGLGAFAIKSAADMETMRVSLKTSFKGNEEEAKKAFDLINEFTAKTPFQLEEVLTGFIKLKNMGLDPSKKALTSYGDTASAMGKNLNQMVEAVADAATGEFERLKEFGIKARSEGDKVTFTFRGVEKTIRKDADAIENYLIELGETEFAGGMEEQSKTLSGVFSTFKDQVTLTMAKVAEDSGMLQIVKDALNSLMTVIDENKEAFIRLVTEGVQVAINWFKQWYESIGGKEGLQQILRDLGDTITKDIIPAILDFFEKVKWVIEKVIKYKDEILILLGVLYALKIAMAGAAMIKAIGVFVSAVTGATTTVELLGVAIGLLPFAITIGIALIGFKLIMNQIAGISDALDDLEGNREGLSNRARELTEKLGGDISDEERESIKNQIQKIAEEQQNIADAQSDIAESIPFVQGTGGGAYMGGFKVNDAIINPKGDIISTHPDDYLIATKDPSKLNGGSTNINITLEGGVYLDRNAGEQLAELLAQNLRLKLRV